MTTTVPVGDGIPPEFYRNAIDLNRFSNSVSKKLVTSYNNVMLKAVEKLKIIEGQPLNERPAYKTARLRALIKQTKESLNSWANGSVDELIGELEGVAKVQAGFVESQLKKSIPKGMAEKIHDQIGYSFRSVAVSPSFAKSVVTTDPTALNIAVLRSDLAGAKTPKGTFKLTAKEGQTITLPNGNTVKKSFLGIAEAEAKRLNQVVRSGLLSGDTTPEIVRELVGNLKKDQKGSLSQLLAQGGAATKSANNQVMTIVRTTVNQVTNTASQAVYKANPDLTEEYRYVATLDSRTSPVCRDLDGQVFKYNEGPVPPQHFGCRSTTVAVVNYKKWGFTPPPAGKRASVDGPVPANTTYGKWLYGERAKGSKFKPGAEQIAALGEQKAKYFNRLSNKYGPDQALKKLIREDNTEVSLAQLQKRYGKPEDIKPKAKKTKLLSDKEKKSLAAFEKIKPPSEALIAKEGKYMTEAEKKGLVPYKPLTAAQKKMVDKSVVETQAKKLDKEMAAIDKQIKESKAKLKALETSGELKSEIATLQKLDDSTKNNLENFKKADLTNKKHQNWFNNQKAFNSKLIPKGKYDTITPKELGKLVEKKEIVKLQLKYDKAFEKSLLPAKPVKPRAPLKKWDDKSFIQKNIGSTDTKTPPPPRVAVRNGKKKTDDLYWEANTKNAVKDYDMSVAQLKDAQEQISDWTGSSFYNIRAVQIKQAQSVGKQLNPNEIGLLNSRIRDNRFMTKAQVNLIARNADKMERYIANTPKWNGSPFDAEFKNAFLDNQPNGTVFRGMTVHKKSIVDEVLKNMERGEAVTTMESWSSDPRTALKFAKGEIGDGNHGIVFRQVNKHGAPIEHLNGMNENEILQPSGVRYKIISKKTENWTFERPGITEEHSMTEVVLQAI